MNVEELRNYCTGLPCVSEDFPFDEDVLAFRIWGKIFAMVNLSDTKWFVLKCNPDLAVELRDAHPEIEPAWHMNKKHWNQINLFGCLDDSFIQELIRHSYSLVVKKFPRRKKELSPEVVSISSTLDVFL